MRGMTIWTSATSKSWNSCAHHITELTCHRLPFLQEPDIGLGIAICTFFDDDEASDSKETRASRLKEFPITFVPFAEALGEDFQTCADFVRSLNQGVQTLNEELSESDKTAWKNAQAYLDARPF